MVHILVLSSDTALHANTFVQDIYYLSSLVDCSLGRYRRLVYVRAIIVEVYQVRHLVLTAENCR